MKRKMVWGLLVLASASLIVSTLMKWSSFSYIEVFGFISGAVCVLLTVEENIWNWPIGIVNNIFFIILFLHSRLYADMGLQVVYLVLGFVGWYQWRFGGKNRSELEIGTSSVKEIWILLVIGALATYSMTVFLRSVNDSAPFLDALTTVLSLIAQYLLTKKAISNWFFWITADFLYIGLYSYKGLILTAVLYAAFLAMCFAGVLIWMKALKEQKTEAEYETV